MKKGMDYPGVVIINYCHDGEGNFVMLKRGTKTRDQHGTWDFGGGGLEFGETLEEALEREMKEEFGVGPLSCQQIGVDDLLIEKDGRPFHWVGIFYKVLVDRDKVHNAEPDMHEEMGWFKLDGLPGPLNPKIPKQLDKFKKHLV